MFSESSTTDPCSLDLISVCSCLNISAADSNANATGFFEMSTILPLAITFVWLFIILISSTARKPMM